MWSKEIVNGGQGEENSTFCNCCGGGLVYVLRMLLSSEFVES